MNAWDRYWFSTVCAARPWLLQRIVLLMLALDCWLLMAGRGGYYGLDGFNVAHFRLLDVLLPAPAGWFYVGLIVAAGALAMFMAIAGGPRILSVVLLITYTLAWAMSRLDQFQHHYLISLVLMCLVFFPTCHRDEREADGRAPAWAYVLLAVTVANVYVWTSIAKLDHEWLAGHALRQQAGEVAIFSFMQRVFAAVGMSQEAYWSFIAVAVIVVELAIATGYLLAPRWADSPARIKRVTLFVVWALAMVLHVGNELIGLRIGWFSYLMMALASVYFLPVARLPLARVMHAADTIVPWRRFVVRCLVFAGVFLLLTALTDGMKLDFYRYRTEGLTALGQYDRALESSSRAMALVLRNGDAAVPVLANHAYLLSVTGRVDEAISLYAHAVSMSPSDVSLLHAYGRALASAERMSQAIAVFSQAHELTPDDVVVMVDLANAYASQGDIAAAEVHYRRALVLSPGHADALLGMAIVHASRGEYDIAMSLLRELLALHPEQTRAKSLLMRLRSRPR